jgi:hypothetical protein
METETYHEVALEGSTNSPLIRLISRSLKSTDITTLQYVDFQVLF